MLLDLFCGGGGAATGYARAGFRVVGVDNDARIGRHYPFEFHQADAMTYPLDGFDAIHASPPCQHHARVTAWRGSRGDHQDLLTPTLARLGATTVPWVVENLPEACPPLRPDYLLCGTQFGLTVRRHRAFQHGGWSSYQLIEPCRCHRNPLLLPFMHKGERAYADAMGCGWMSAKAARQAIPPAFTEHIGLQLIAAL
jgi:SAM-dependent methyltransferase